jgi:hypothetical protein
MPYLPARSGLARSGVTYTGWSQQTFRITIGGTTRTTDISSVTGSGSVSNQLDQPSRCEFTVVSGTAPVAGQPVVVTRATPNEHMFSGSILSVRAQSFNQTTPTLYHCSCADLWWLLNRRLVTKQYRDLSANAILADIVGNYTVGGFTVGYAPETLGTIAAFDCTLEPAGDAIRRLAKACGGAYVDIDPERHITMAATFPVGNAPSLDDDSPLVQPTLTRDVSQTRTTQYIIGGSTRALGPSDPGVTTIAVEDTGRFRSTAGGFALVGQNIVTYTGKSTANGNGLLTGCTGINYLISEGDTVSVLETDSLGSTAGLGAILGGSDADGVIQDAFSLDGLDATAADAAAVNEVDVFGTNVATLEYGISDDRYTRVGQVATVAITDPMTISGTFTVQNVMEFFQRPPSGTSVVVAKRITVSPYHKRLTQVLNDVVAAIR